VSCEHLSPRPSFEVLLRRSLWTLLQAHVLSLYTASSSRVSICIAQWSLLISNERDKRIAAGLLLLTGLSPNIKDPKNGVTIPPFRPKENYHFETQGPGVIVAFSVCMVILTLVTFLRLGIRLFVHGVRFGADDWLIIPAYLLSMAYPAFQIAMVKYGGAGKHFYDITYQEYFYYKSVSHHSTNDPPDPQLMTMCSSRRQPRLCSTSMWETSR
jgi:hypothetical protein